MKYFRMFSLLAAGGIGLLFSTLLLVHGYLDGSEFVALFLMIALFTVVLLTGKNITELSIGGNIIKLEEVKSELESTVVGLRTSTIEILKIHIILARNLTNNDFQKLNSNKDERIDNFWHIHGVIQDLDIENELSIELLETLNILARNQLFNLSHLCEAILNVYKHPFDMEMQLPETRELRKLTVKRVESNGASGPSQSPNDSIDHLLDGIEHYDKLFKLIKRLSDKS
ncbi:hypothetical protein ACNO7T_10790 [Vibrio campbellii]